MNLLIVFKHESPWNDLCLSKFAVLGNTSYIYADKVYNQVGSFGLAQTIKDTIDSKAINTVVFDADFVPFVDAAMINLLPQDVSRILITFDDLVMHQINSVNAHVCDFVLSADPISVLKYLEKGINSYFIPLDGDAGIYMPTGSQKDIDVLFFGALDKPGRTDILDFLKTKGISVRVIGPSAGFVGRSELVELINRSKIVLNLSLSDDICKYETFFPRCDCTIDVPLLQFKGRIIEVGLCGTVCVSEYAPSVEMLFAEDEVPVFRSHDECLKIIRSLLANNDLRTTIASKLHRKVMAEYENTAIMKRLKIDWDAMKPAQKRFVPTPLYRRYVFNFKIRHNLGKPKMLMREIRYLHQCRLMPLYGCEAFSSIFILARVILKMIMNKLRRITRL